MVDKSKKWQSTANKSKSAEKENAMSQACKGKGISLYKREREENMVQNQALWRKIVTSDP